MPPLTARTQLVHFLGAAGDDSVPLCLGLLPYTCPQTRGNTTAERTTGVPRLTVLWACGPALRPAGLRGDGLRLQHCACWAEPGRREEDLGSLRLSLKENTGPRRSQVPGEWARGVMFPLPRLETEPSPQEALRPRGPRMPGRRAAVGPTFRISDPVFSHRRVGGSSTVMEASRF